MWRRVTKRWRTMTKKRETITEIVGGEGGAVVFGRVLEHETLILEFELRLERGGRNEGVGWGRSGRREWGEGKFWGMAKSGYEEGRPLVFVIRRRGWGG